MLSGSAIPETARDQALNAPTPLLSAERLQVMREAALEAATHTLTLKKLLLIP
jgi:hypothetical protein